MRSIRWRGLRAPGIWVLLSIIAAIVATFGVSNATALAAGATPNLSSQEGSCAAPVSGQSIYDCAHLLTPAEIAMLEQQAAAVERAGAPTVVYLQVRDATAQQTLQDAIDLMNRWNVESHPGAHDGFVMFFNLQPGNLRHGQVALYAGAKHYNGGNLPQDELDRIRTDVMTPLLANGQTAEGIAAGLQMVAHDLQYGPPPSGLPPAVRDTAATLGRIPFNLLAALLAGIVGLLFARQARRPALGDATAPITLASPGDLQPAVAGALVTGRVNDAQMEATILDFARRGLVVIEPTGKDQVRLRLVGSGDGLTGYEQEVWTQLADHAMPNGEDGEHGELTRSELADVRGSWGWAKSLLRRELTERGWFDSEGAAAQRRPFYIAGTIAVVGAVAGLALVIISREAWAVIGVVLFTAAGTLAFVRAFTTPNTTANGEIAAAPWRAYCETVAAKSYEPKLDTDLPYIVALGLLGALGPRLKAASERGYAPSWFRGVEEPGAYAGGHPMAVGFYPYWIAFHTSMAPVSTGSASGGYMGAGAAGGGGGSAGSF